MTTYYGIVDKNGDVKIEGSGNWISTSRGTGLTLVTLSGASSDPVPVVSPASNSLDSYQEGVTTFINITDLGTDENGRRYFGVATNDPDHNLVARSFSFIAEAS